MVEVDVAEQDAVYLTQPWIIGPADCVPRIIKNACPVWILKNHRSIKGAEFTVMTAKRGDLHIR
jgi:hypothetical protein